MKALLNDMMACNGRIVIHANMCVSLLQGVNVAVQHDGV